MLQLYKYVISKCIWYRSISVVPYRITHVLLITQCPVLCNNYWFIFCIYYLRILSSWRDRIWWIKFVNKESKWQQSANTQYWWNVRQVGRDCRSSSRLVGGLKCSLPSRPVPRMMVRYISYLFYFLIQSAFFWLAQSYFN